MNSTTEQTTTCPKCGLVCQGPRIRPHNCAARQAHPERYLPPNLPRPAAPSGPDSTGRKGGPAEEQAPAPGTLSKGAKPLTLAALGAMPLVLAGESEDATLGRQLTEQWERAIGGTREQIVFGAMMLKLKARIATGSARGATKGSHDPTSSGTGLKGWLKTHAPKVGESTAYRLMEIAEGVQDLCKLGKKVDLEELLAGSVEDLPERLAKKREEIEKLIEGKSQRQLLLAFGGGSGKARGGDTSHAKKLSPEEEQAALEAALREDATAPFKAFEAMGEAWRILNDAEIEGAIDIAEEWVKKARAWLSAPKNKRPVLDRVKAILKEAH